MRTDERFLSYLPHSGFHNQRIAFENALVLARLLNRTLLVPPVRLGHTPLRYVQYERLKQFLVLSGKEGLQHCTHIPDVAAMPSECLGYFDYTYVPWQCLVNSTEIASSQFLRHRWNMTDAWLKDALNISDSRTLTLRDSGPYDYRFLDTPNDVSPKSDKYAKSIYIDSLATSQHQLIQIGTLFGSSRLRLKSPENIEIRKQIRRSMAFNNAHLGNAADAVSRALGNTYLGAHVRLGDGQFRKNAQLNARLVWWKLVHQLLEFSIEETLTLERRLSSSDATHGALTPPLIPPDAAAARTPHPPLGPLPNSTSATLPCRGPPHQSPSHSALNIPLFISTDALDPLRDPLLAPFLRTFPCTFFLADFPAVAPALANPYDRLPLAGFLAPFLDAMVVGRAWGAVGTEGSTFSRFVTDVLWRRYHGWEIVLRG